MEPRYPVFIALSTLKGFQLLRESTSRTGVTATHEAVTDAARLGMRHALARLYPGLVRPPYQRDPLPDVVLAIRYQFEDDPENLGLSPSYDTSATQPISARTPTPLPIGSSPRASGQFPLPAGESSAKLQRLAVRPSIAGGVVREETPSQVESPKGLREDVTPVPVAPSGEHAVSRGVLFPWEKKKG